MKDAKGHGSNARGNMSVPDRHQYKIAVDTVKNPMKGMFLGGPSAAEAEATLRGKFGHSDADIARMKGDDHVAASELARGNPKSGTVPVHAGTGGSGSFFGRSASGAKAANKEANDFQRSRATSGPHYLDPKDPRPQSAINRIKQPADVIGRPWKGR